MPHYLQLGSLPRKRHLKFPREVDVSYQGEGLHYEHVVTTEGFDRAYSILYHLKPPTRVKSVGLFKEFVLKPGAPLPLRHHHLKSAGMVRAGDPYTGRVPLMFNDDIGCYRCRPATAMALSDRALGLGGAAHRVFKEK